MAEQFDFIAIGDVVTDAFIRIQQASVCFDEKDHEEKLAFTNGSKIPYEFAKIVAAVGNSANAAVAATRLGLKTAFISDTGDDEHGKEIIATLKAQGVSPEYVNVHQGIPANYHYVLWFKAERTILIRHEDYPRKFPEIPSPRWIYLSSLGDNTMPYHEEIVSYIKAHPETKLAFQPGTYQIKFGADALKEIYARTEVFFCNKEEAQLILKIQEAPCAELAKKMSELGPKISVITDGPRGAFTYVAATGEAWHVPQYPDPAPPYDRTGAGDAFSSTFTAMLALGKTVEEAMTIAPINSMSVVQKIGAQEGLLSLEALHEWLAKAPAEYKAVKV